VQKEFAQQFGHYYPDLRKARVSPGAGEYRVSAAAGLLADVTGALNLRGIVVPALFLTAIAGTFVAPPPLRRSIVLHGGLATLLLVIPVATLIFNARYGVPAYGLLALAGVLGVSAIVEARRRPETAEATVPA